MRSICNHRGSTDARSKCRRYSVCILSGSSAAVGQRPSISSSLKKKPKQNRTKKKIPFDSVRGCTFGAAEYKMASSGSASVGSRLSFGKESHRLCFGDMQTRDTFLLGVKKRGISSSATLHIYFGKASKRRRILRHKEVGIRRATEEYRDANFWIMTTSPRQFN